MYEHEHTYRALPRTELYSRDPIIFIPFHLLRVLTRRVGNEVGFQVTDPPPQRFKVLVELQSSKRILTFTYDASFDCALLVVEPCLTNYK
jgi:hypothetical protein